MSLKKQWYAVYTKPRWEKKVAELLTKKGVQNYCPVNKVRKQWADRKKTVLEPLFTSYVFVYVSEVEHLLLKQTTGVINLVYWLGKPAVIRDEEIFTIKNFLDTHINVALERTPVNVHDTVRIIKGPLSDQEGQVIERRAKTVKVLLPSLGFIMKAEIGITQLEVIRAAAIPPENQGYRYAL